MEEVQERSWEAILGLRLPSFAITATRDRIVDNHKVRTYLEPLFRSPANCFMQIDAGRTVQFEQPDELALALLEFIGSESSPARCQGIKAVKKCARKRAGRLNACPTIASTAGLVLVGQAVSPVVLIFFTASCGSVN
jgi:hypothetical protein